MFKKTSTQAAPWIVINSDNKMIARLNAMRYVLSNIQYVNKKKLKPKKWSKETPSYGLNLYGVNFDDLTFEQYLVLSKFKKHE